MTTDATALHMIPAGITPGTGRRTATLAVANQAGSAGKTTTAVTLAGLLADSGRTVQVIDLDSQANATWWLGAQNAATTIGDVLTRKVTITDATYPTGIDRLSIVPAAHELDAQAVDVARALGGEQRLRQALTALDEADRPDVTIIDCPGSLGVLTVAALVAATAVITVATPTVKELAGVPRLEQTIADIAGAYNPSLRLEAIIPCIVPAAQAGALYVEALELMTTTWDGRMTPPVRRSVRVPEAYSTQTPLSRYAPREAVTGDYTEIVAWLTTAGVL